MVGAASKNRTVPVAHTRIVVGHRASFLYIEYCPLCGLEHMHGQFPLRGENSDPRQALKACDGYRCSHCGPHGLGHIVKKRKGGKFGLVKRKPPPEYREPKGYSYQLVLGLKAACFTPRGSRSKDARSVMAQLARAGIATSNEILRPRRAFVLDYGG
jgi:hypothetical protein